MSLTWEQAVAWLRDQPDQQELVRACYFDDPLDAAAARYAASTEWQAVRALLPATPGRALDVGAGRGVSAYALARDGWQTTALEPDPSPLVGAGAIRSLVAATGVAIRVVQDRGDQLPFGSGSFDLVFGRQVLHHATNLPGLCRQIARVLAPGGLFIAAREHVISRKKDLDQFLEEHPLHHLYGGENAYLLDEYRQAIEDAGIRIERVLNPFESDINQFPETVASLRQRIAGKLRLPAAMVPMRAVTWVGGWLGTPGRLYTFVGRRR